MSDIPSPGTAHNGPNPDIPRPSVTDNARAEEQSGYTVQQTAAHFARSVQRVSDRIQRTDYRRSVVDVVALESVQRFLDRIARDDLGVYAAGRAETTTATDEDARLCEFCIERPATAVTPGDEYGICDDCSVPPTTEWAVRDDELNGHITYARDEEDARLVAEARGGRDYGHVVVRREVTPWTEAE